MKQSVIRVRSFVLLSLLLFAFVSIGSVSAQVAPLTYREAQSPRLDLSEAEKDWLKDHPTIRFTGDPDWLPQEAYTEDGDYIGIAAEMLDLLEARLGINFERVPPKTWSEALRMAETGEVDILSETKGVEREGLIFTDPYLVFPVAIIVRADSPSAVDPDDLRGRRVAVVRDYGYVQLFQIEYPDLDYMVVDNVQEGLLSVSSGRADAFISATSTASYQILELGLTSLKFSGNTGFTTDLALGVRRDWSTLVHLINKALATITLEETTVIVERWFGTAAAHEVLSRVRFTPEEIRWLAEHPVIRVSHDLTWPPFDFHENDAPTGFSIDHLELLASRIGFEIEYVDGHWFDLLAKGRDKELDMMLNIAASPERSEFLLFTKSYANNPTGIFIHQDSKDIRSIDDLRSGKQVSVGKGFYQEEILRRVYPEMTLVPFKNTLAGLSAVSAGEVDAHIDFAAVGNYIVGQQFITGINAIGLTGIAELDNTPLSYGVRSDWPILVSILEKGMATITTQEDNQIRNKWLGLSAALLRESQLELTVKEQSWIKEHPVITLGFNREVEPLVIVDENGGLSGILIDIYKKLETITGIKIHIEIGEWPSIIQSASVGEIDGLLVSALSLAESIGLIHTDRLTVGTPTVFAKNDAPFEITSVQDLEDKKISVLKGLYMVQQAIEPYKDAIEVIETESALEMMKMVYEGKVDAAFGLSYHNFLIGKHSLVGIGPVYFSSKSSADGVASVRTEWPEFVSIINKGLDSIGRAGLGEISDKWTRIKAAPQLLLTAEEKAWLVDHPIIRVGADSDWAPMEFLGADGNYQGLSIDYLKRIELMLDVRFEFVRENWQELMAQAKQRRLDIFTSVAKTPDRGKYLFFTDPYIQMPAGVFAREGVAFIADLNMLSHEEIAVVEGYAIHEYLVSHYPDIDLVLVETPEEGIRVVAEEKAFAFIDNTITTGHLLSRKGYSHIRLAGEVPFVYAQSMGVRKDWPLLRDILQKAIDAIPEGERNAIYNQWVPVTYEKRVDYSLFWKIGLGVLILICLVLVWNRKLASEVHRRTLALKDSEARHIEAQRMAHIGHWELNLVTNELFWSDEQYAIFEIDKEKFGASYEAFLELVPDDERDYVDKAYTDSVKNGSAYDIVHRFLFEGDRIKYVQERCRTEYDEQGNPLRSIGTTQDITKRRQAEVDKGELEKQLIQIQKMEAIGTLAGGIAHDFNNILGAIMGYAEMVREELQEGSSAYEMQEQVVKAGLRAKDLVQQILLFSRQSDQETKPVQPHLVIKEALKLLRSSIPATIEIQQRIPTDCGSILADTTQLHQIVMNLCTNAYHAMRESGGVLSVALSRVDVREEDVSFSDLQLDPGRYLKLEIGDTGHGMNRATLARIFDPYFTTKPKGEGTGLGLSVALGIVQSYRGVLKVYSEPGEGTNIHIYFPRLEAAGEAQESRAESFLPTGKERVLVVDDEEPLLGMMTKILDSLGYQVVAHRNSQDALDTFKADAGSFDLVVTDMTMPHMTGLELIKQIYVIRPKTPVILCTGFSELINEERAQALGIRKLLTKPILRSDMAKAVRQVLDGE
jgi:ABC-type amino acid transport substrate-binding protein/signal transduction histidine kinase/ActR/RegA family two-component response regulator